MSFLTNPVWSTAGGTKHANASLSSATRTTARVRGDLTPHELRHGTPFRGHRLPFGCAVEYKPHAIAEVNQQLKFEPKTRPGVFMGYHIHAGGKWSGDYLVVDADAYQQRPDRANVKVHRTREIIPTLPPVFPALNGALQHADYAEERARRLRRRPFGVCDLPGADPAPAPGARAVPACPGRLAVDRGRCGGAARVAAGLVGAACGARAEKQI